MIDLSTLMQGLIRGGDQYAITVTDDWLQGRTILWRSRCGHPVSRARCEI